MMQSREILKREIHSLLNAGQPARAKALCLQLCQSPGNDGQAWILLGNVNLQLGQFSEAESAGREAVALDGNDADALMVLVQALLFQGKNTEAIIALRELARLLPDSAGVHGQLADLLHRKGDLDGAERHYRRAVALDPRHFMARLNYAVVLQKLGNLVAAVKNFSTAAQINPDSMSAHAGLGGALLALRRNDEAVAALERARTLAPDNALVHNSLGGAYQAQNRLREAVASCQRAIRIRPDLVEAHVNLGRALQKSGDIRGAIAAHHKALELDPGNAAAFHNLAISLYDDRHPETALDYFKKALEHDSGNALAHCFAGITYAQLGQEADASRHFQLSHELSSFTGCIVDSYRYASQSGPSARYFASHKQLLMHAVESITLDGLFLEFGVYYGESIRWIASQTSHIVHGFDLFEGIPEAWNTGGAQGDETEPPGAYSTHGRLPEVPPNVMLHAGFFDETLPAFMRQFGGPVAFMNVDCDLYSSTKTIFGHLGNRIQAGTIIVFDEYLCYPKWRDHEFKAFQEFITETGLTYEYLAFNIFTGQAAVRITRTRPA